MKWERLCLHPVAAKSARNEMIEIVDCNGRWNDALPSWWSLININSWAYDCLNLSNLRGEWEKVVILKYSSFQVV